MYTPGEKWEEVGINVEAKNSATLFHAPVLLDEVLVWLACRPGGRYLDCTIGLGGHAERILEATAPGGIVIGLDRDGDAVEATAKRLSRFGERLRLIHSNFRELKQHLGTTGCSQVDGVLFDLGVSSPQIDRPERGFSFSLDGPLDMRMDRREPRTAADLVNHLPERELANLIYQYGEERFARRIARAIVRARQRAPLRTTGELVAVIRGAVPGPYRHGRLHCATRTFQALRIAVNGELDGLEGALRDAADVLTPGGRLCVVSFQSLEDRIVKQTIRALAGGPEPRLRSLTKKPIVPSDRECDQNPRARSAKLRVAERLPTRRSV
ncbi:16S rRNA (cytosine(1402)-N(4))-methyltransferase RsmH [Nitrospira sp. Kam-Ns4a]